MEIQKNIGDTKGEFYIEEQGQKSAEMTFSKAGEDTIIIDHTYVDDSLRGEGIGEKLVMAGVSYARDNNLKIIPLCPFAKSVFDKKEDIKDVLKK